MKEKVARFRTDDQGRNVWVEGHVVIEGVEHYVLDGYIKCNPALNHKAWDVTEEVSQCPECFGAEKEMEYLPGKQLNMFD